MRKVISHLIICFCILSSNLSFGQDASLNSYNTLSPQEQYRNLDAFVEAYYTNKTYNYRQGNAMKHIPVSIHLIANFDGSNAAKLVDKLELICDANETLEGTDIYLKVENINYINSTIINTEDNIALVQSFTNPFNIENTLNIFFMGENPNFYYCSTVDPDEDQILIGQGNNCAEFSLAFEVGRYLSLLRTSYGWRFTDYTCETTAPSSVNYDNQNLAVELLDGSNCSSAGDRICDTKPNYQNTSYWDCDANGEGSCEHIDPSGASFYPDGSNLMASSDCSTTFSTDQIAAMHFNLETVRTYLDLSLVDTNPITALSPVAPLPDENIGLTTSVTLEWLADGANQYYLQVSSIANFNIQTFLLVDEVLTSTSYTLQNLDLNEDYFWRVLPFKSGNVCAPVSSYFKFITSEETAIHSAQASAQMYIYPNPINEGDFINIELETETAFEATIEIYNTSGQQLTTPIIQSFNNGINSIQLATNNLIKGVYILSIQSDKEKINHKILVQ